MTGHFSADWLALREPFDHAARSVALAQRFAALLPPRPCVMDIGAGTGSMFRFLAPIIGRGQDWLLVDADGALLDEAFGVTAAWARRQGFGATAEGDTLSLSTRYGLWRMRIVTKNVAAGFKPCHDVHGLVCSALLDLVSARWLASLYDTLAVPFLACLTVNGRDTWRPHHPSDALVHTAFRRDMRRDKGFGPALGTSALDALTATASAASDWRISRTALRMQRALIDGTAEAARNARPGHADTITEWQAARMRQALRGRLAITIGHRDILVLPPGG